MFNDQDILQQYRIIRYVNSIELAFKLNSDHQKYGNQMAVPVLILNYEEINSSAILPDDIYKEFTFKISFTKYYKFQSLFDVRVFLYFLISLI